MLHLHCLVWLRGVFHISKLRNQLRSDPAYTTRMIQFIDRIIKCSIVPARRSDGPKLDAPLASLNETDQEFAQRLEDDSNAVASKCQLHSSSHNATCFEYGAAATGQCRFDFPRPCNDQTKMTEQGNIEVFRNGVQPLPPLLGVSQQKSLKPPTPTPTLLRRS